MKKEPPIQIKDLNWYLKNNPEAFVWLEKSIVNPKGIILIEKQKR